MPCPAPGLLVSLLVAVPLAPAARHQKLTEGVQSYQDLDSEDAGKALREVLASNPTSEEEGVACMYLGLIAFDAVRVTEARALFRRALTANPALEMPRHAAPKAKALFRQVSRQVVRDGEPSQPPQQQPPDQVGGQPRAPAPSLPAPTSLPSPGLAPPPTMLVVPEVIEGSHPSYTAVWITGGLSVAALGVGAAFGGLQLAAQSDFNSQKNVVPKRADANAIATDGLTADVLFGASAAGAIVTAILFFTAGHGDTAAPSVEVSGTGATLGIAGQW